MDKNPIFPAASTGGNGTPSTNNDASHGVRQYQSLLLEWLARSFRAPRLPHQKALLSPYPGDLAIGFSGHSTSMVRYHDATVLFDPMFGQFCGVARREVQAGSLPLSRVDVVVISRLLKGHLHIPSLKQLPRDITVVGPVGLARKISDLGFSRVVELRPDASYEIGNLLLNTSAPHCPRIGPALNFLLEGNGPSIFMCGGSGYFHGFREIGHRHKPDIAYLPIGGYSPAGFRKRNMTPPQALQAFIDLQSKALIPHRYGTFPLSYEHLSDPGVWLEKAVRERALNENVFPIKPGETQEFRTQSFRKNLSRTAAR